MSSFFWGFFSGAGVTFILIVLLIFFGVLNGKLPGPN